MIGLALIAGTNELAVDEVFWRWATWCDNRTQEKEEQAEQGAADLTVKQEEEETAAMAEASEEEKQRIIFEKEEAIVNAKELEIAKVSGEEWVKKD